MAFYECIYGGSGDLFATVDVTYSEGCLCTMVKGSTTLTAEDTSGHYLFNVDEAGEWSICLDGDEKDTIEVEEGYGYIITVSHGYIWGIARTSSTTATDPAWTRTDDSVALVGGLEPEATIGTSVGQSVFDNVYPWSHMGSRSDLTARRESLDADHVMVWIPPFYYQRKVNENNLETIKISSIKPNADKSNAPEGFKWHKGSGRYIGAYETGTGGKISKSGQVQEVSKTRAWFRTQASSISISGLEGTWCQRDELVTSAIQMLYLVEFANYNSQLKIGNGNVSNSAGKLKTGSADSVANLTGAPSNLNTVACVYRGIENPWGNVWEWSDGLCCNGTEYWICEDPQYYKDDVGALETGWTKSSIVGATSGWNNYNISRLGFDNNNEWAMLVDTCNGSTNTVGVCDSAWTSANKRVCYRGGGWEVGSACGLFAFSVSALSYVASPDFGGRLVFIPNN